MAPPELQTWKHVKRNAVTAGSSWRCHELAGWSTFLRLLLHQQEQHVFHIVLDGTGFVCGDRTEAKASRAAAGGVTREKTERCHTASTWFMFLQDLQHLQ